jgi:radical SAM superfamily enzyme YgiQ (UPF0313 family)
MHKEKKKILLMMLPFWDPLIPALGISCLKSYLQLYGYQVKTIDANIKEEFRELQNDYFNRLIEYIPQGNRRHLYNIGHEVLKNHMMAYLEKKDQKEYVQLVKILVFKTFFSNIADNQVDELNSEIREFYLRLEKYILHILDTEKPAVMGLSVYGSTLPASLFTFRLVKEKSPHILTVMGGGIFSGELAIHSPDFDIFLKKTPYIDKIIVGEGEKLFLRLLQGELPESQKVYTLKDINEEILDMSRVEIPDFSDFDLRYYPQMAAYTSRSCPYQCGFCVETTYWGKYRKKSGRQIVEELMRLYRRHNKRLFLMCDSLLNPVITDAANEFKQEKVSIYWGGYLRVNAPVCDIENTIQWRQGGFYRARLGVESGSPRILEKMNKKIDIQQIKTSISSLAYAGIKTTIMFVIGYPEETGADFQKTLDLIEELKDDIYEADCNPFWYYYNGQVNARQWKEKNKPTLLYPQSVGKFLILQTWTLGGEPTREETYNRVNRFIQHCNTLKIPNPYSLKDTNTADKRWKRLHKNAVPSLLEINSGDACGDECRNVKKFVFAGNIFKEDGNWGF